MQEPYLQSIAETYGRIGNPCQWMNTEFGSSIRRFAPTRDEAMLLASCNPTLTLSSGEAAYRRAGLSRVRGSKQDGLSIGFEV